MKYIHANKQPLKSIHLGFIFESGTLWRADFYDVFCRFSLFRGHGGDSELYQEEGVRYLNGNSESFCLGEKEVGHCHPKFQRETTAYD